MHYDSGPNMTPLVDIVMVILIFMMLAGSFGGLEHYLVSTVPYNPRGTGAVEAKLDFVPDEPLEIRVDSPMPDKWVARAGRIEQVGDAGSLTARLAAMRKQMESAGKSADKIQVVLSPGRNVKYEHLIDVYQAALRAEFTKISFATAH